MAIGIVRAGHLGGIVAWLGFTWPSAAAMIAFAYGVSAIGDVSDAGWLHGLKVVAVAVVALAVWGMARTLCPDRPRITLAISAAGALLFFSGALVQIAVIVAGGLIGWLLLRPGQPAAEAHAVTRKGRSAAAPLFLAAFLVLLAALPLLRQAADSEAASAADTFYRVGSLVFGGGHVILPVMEAEVVGEGGLLTRDEFIAGYGAAQAVPGPLFTFAGYVGALLDLGLPMWAGGVFAVVVVFLPSYLLVASALPIWDRLGAISGFRRALMGINAAVVGLLLAALYDPVWTSAIESAEDSALALATFALLAFWKLPPWLVVALSAAAGAALAALQA